MVEPEAMTQPTVFLVDDDEAVREPIAWMLKRNGIQVETYATPNALLKAYDETKSGCLLLDLRLPEMDGLELYRRLVEMGCKLPFIMFTAHGEVQNTKKAMQMGALDFVEKPIEGEVLLDCVKQAIDEDERRRRERAEYEIVQQRLDRLTGREREVLDLVAAGKLTKQISRQLDISVKTVEAHRSNITRKMHADSTIHLIRLITAHNFSRFAAT